MQRLYALITVLIIMQLVGLVVVNSEVRVSRILYDITYYPVEDTGTANIEITLSSSDLSLIEIPLNIFFTENAVIGLVSYDVSGDLRVTGLEESQGSVKSYVIGSGVLTLHVYVANITEESLGAYTLYVDTMDLANLTQDIRVRFTLIGEYNVVEVFPERNFTNFTAANTTILEFTGPGYWVATFKLGFEEITSPSVPSTSEPFRSPLFIFTAISIAIIVVVVLMVYFYRFRGRILVESIDYTRDEASRLILRALRESGNKGLTQTELSKITGLPKSVISRRVRKLEDDGFIEVKRTGKYSYVYLTNKGLELAKRVAGKGE